MLSGFLQFPFLLHFILLIEVDVFAASKAVNFVSVCVNVCDFQLPEKTLGMPFFQASCGLSSELRAISWKL